jgi:hypothetical protein
VTENTVIRCINMKDSEREIQFEKKPETFCH